MSPSVWCYHLMSYADLFQVRWVLRDERGFNSFLDIPSITLNEENKPSKENIDKNSPPTHMFPKSEISLNLAYHLCVCTYICMSTSIKLSDKNECAFLPNLEPTEAGDVYEEYRIVIFITVCWNKSGFSHLVSEWQSWSQTSLYELLMILHCGHSS